ncbi:hypothetical protein MAR_002146 [Mya arenaria]|uniref:Uncharacterized protein n=1 Tax=Mya arenaria TaxID=6604 RepID=A0ABY7FDP4_MYAAR|nr:hypothetical protein MAR_002146 [Mya arenaria]
MSPAQEKILSDGTDVAGIPSSWRATCATRGKRPSFFFHHASGLASSSEGSCRYRRSSSLAVLVVFGTMKLRRGRLEGPRFINGRIAKLEICRSRRKMRFIKKRAPAGRKYRRPDFGKDLSRWTYHSFRHSIGTKSNGKYGVGIYEINIRLTFTVTEQNANTLLSSMNHKGDNSDMKSASSDLSLDFGESETDQPVPKRPHRVREPRKPLKQPPSRPVLLRLSISTPSSSRVKI